MVLYNIAIAGGTGNLGPKIIQALLDAGHSVTVLTRSKSNILSKFATSPKLKTAIVDYTSTSSLQSALEENKTEIVISAVASEYIESQKALVDASIAAGVKRFIPSEFGSDTVNEKAAALPCYAEKVEMQRYLQAKAKESCNFSYTIVLCGPFLDLGLDWGYIVNVAARQATLWDGGDRPFSTTTLSHAADGVVAVLQHLEETRNKAVRIHDAVLTQNKIIDIAKRKDGREWEIVHMTTDQAMKNSYEASKQENPSHMESSVGYIRKAIFGEGYGGDFSGHVDNEWLGLSIMSDKEVEELIWQRL